MYLQPLLCLPPPFPIDEKQWKESDLTQRGCLGSHSWREQRDTDAVQLSQWMIPSVQQAVQYHAAPHPHGAGTCAFSGLCADQVLFMNIAPESFLHGSKVPEAPKPCVFYLSFDPQWTDMKLLIVFTYLLRAYFICLIHMFDSCLIVVAAPDFVQYIYVLHFPLSIGSSLYMFPVLYM